MDVDLPPGEPIDPTAMPLNAALLARDLGAVLTPWWRGGVDSQWIEGRLRDKGHDQRWIHIALAAALARQEARDSRAARASRPKPLGGAPGAARNVGRYLVERQPTTSMEVLEQDLRAAGHDSEVIAAARAGLDGAAAAEHIGRRVDRIEEWVSRILTLMHLAAFVGTSAWFLASVSLPAAILAAVLLGAGVAASWWLGALAASAALDYLDYDAAVNDNLVVNIGRWLALPISILLVVVLAGIGLALVLDWLF